MLNRTISHRERETEQKHYTNDCYACDNLTLLSLTLLDLLATEPIHCVAPSKVKYFTF